MFVFLLRFYTLFFPLLARNIMKHDEAILIPLLLRGMPIPRHSRECPFLHCGSAPSFCHCEEYRKAYHPPVIARKGEALTKQSLFSRTSGISIPLRLNYQRLPRALTGPRNDKRSGVALTEIASDANASSQ